MRRGHGFVRDDWLSGKYLKHGDFALHNKNRWSLGGDAAPRDP